MMHPQQSVSPSVRAIGPCNGGSNEDRVGCKEETSSDVRMQVGEACFIPCKTLVQQRKVPVAADRIWAIEPPIQTKSALASKQTEVICSDKSMCDHAVSNVTTESLRHSSYFGRRRDAASAKRLLAHDMRYNAGSAKRDLLSLLLISHGNFRIKLAV